MHRAPTEIDNTFFLLGGGHKVLAFKKFSPHPEKTCLASLHQAFSSIYFP